VIKDDLVKQIAARFDLSLNFAGKILQTFLDELITGLVSDGHIELRRFGVFGIKHQAHRIITLPSGKKITRPACLVVTFAPSPTVKKKLNPPPPPKPRHPNAGETPTETPKQGCAPRGPGAGNQRGVHKNLMAPWFQRPPAATTNKPLHQTRSRSLVSLLFRATLSRGIAVFDLTPRRR